ncbi:MAG: AarF/UbiB family protein [Myxococcota bacterium]|nr:AarF/UbiB family protein [Myxococcota bacterium]
MQFVRPVVKTTGTLARTVQNMGRVRQVSLVLARHGLGMLVSGVELPGVKVSRRFESTPDRTVAAIQELGPTFIKLGQVLSTRADVIPAAYIDALQSLQDNVTPLPFSDIDAQMSRELGADWRGRFASFEEVPLATASIAQVHRAQLHDGREVVLKVQRPGIGPRIRADLGVLRLLASQAMAEFPEVAMFDPKGILEEFQKSILAELNFNAEIRNLNRFRRSFADSDEVIFPEPVRELSTERVLCMEFLDGVPIRSARSAGFDMDIVGRRYLDIAYAMLFDHGFFHGDLHPGNVLVLADGRIGVIDCGMVGRLTGEMKDNIAALIFALDRGDYRTISRLYFDIAIKESRVDYAAFERDAVEVVERHWSGGSIAEMHIGAYLMDLTRASIRHSVHAPPEFTMFFKAILTTEGLAKALLPEVDPIGAAQPFVQQLLADRWGRERLEDEGSYTMLSMSSLARRLPITLTQLLDDIDRQRLKFNVMLEQPRSVQDAHDRRQNRMILSMYAITGAICGSVCLFWEAGRIFGIPVLSVVFYAAALPLFLLTLAMTLRNRG